MAPVIGPRDAFSGFACDIETPIQNTACTEKILE